MLSLEASLFTRHSGSALQHSIDQSRIKVSSKELDVDRIAMGCNYLAKEEYGGAERRVGGF